MRACSRQDYEDVLALPGIGRYTAGAILSISRDARLPILEGNTQRLFSRWIALQAPANDRAATKLLWEVSEAMLPRKETGKFNQAAMELGALICSPKKPNCDQCPVSRYCQAKAIGQQESIPGKVSRVKYEDRTEYAMVVRQNSTARRKQGYLVRILPEGDGGLDYGIFLAPPIVPTPPPSLRPMRFPEKWVCNCRRASI